MKYDLSGTWQFMLDGEKAGLEKEYFLRTAFADMIELPTTTAEAKRAERAQSARQGI